MVGTPARPALYLVDALPYVFRAYFAIREMKSPQGAPVQAVYGFAAFLLQLLREEPLTHIAVAFDESLTSSFRNMWYPAYKANRELPPPELVQQLAYCQAVARALGITVLVDQQYEADDLIGTLAHQVAGHDLDMVVVSSDKDLMQLVTPCLTMYDFAKQRRVDVEGVIAHLGVRPEQVPDLLGLQGDSVDNIPGVPGVGTKTALALLRVFTTLEALYADLSRVETLPLRGAKALAHKLAAGREFAFMSKRLATIALDAPVTCTLDTLRYQGAEAAAVMPLFAELGFKRLGQLIPAWRS